MALQTAHKPSSEDPSQRLPDPVLLDGVREGDSGSLQALIDRYWRPLLGFACQIVEGEDAAEDVVQHAFIRFWERRERWRAGSAPKLILYTLVRNLALNHVESERARVRRSRDRRVPNALVATPAQMLEERELMRALDGAVQALPARRREALVLARFHHMSHAEIAGVMGLAQRTVTNHITTALAEIEIALRQHLEGEDRSSGRGG